MNTRRSEWEEDTDFAAEQGRYLSLKKYNNLLISGRWYNKFTKDAQILALFGVSQNLVYYSKKAYDKPTRETTKGDPAYIRDFQPWMTEDPKGGVGKKTKDEN